MIATIKTPEKIFIRSYEDESSLYKGIGESLLELKNIPTTMDVECPDGTARYNITKRGKYIKNGITMPSIYVTEAFNNISLPSSIYKEVYLTCINEESNNYKFYHMMPIPRGIDVEYGRIGSKAGEIFGRKKINIPYASRMFWIRYYEKLSKGYVDQSKVYLTKAVSSKEAKEATYSNDAEKELTELLYNCSRNVVVNSLVNESVTKGQISEAKKILRQLYNRTTVKGFNNQLKKLMQVTPRKVDHVSRLLAHSPNDFPRILQREESLVNSMTAVAAPTNRFTDVEIFEANAKQIEKVRSHLSDRLKGKVDKIYRVIPKAQKKKFNNYLKKNNIKQIRELCHGSRNENWYSIIQNSLQLNPDAQITGKMFGDGIYFAPSSEKSWNYTSYMGTSWAGGRDTFGVMGIYACAYGNPEFVSSSRRFSKNILDSLGKNCVHAQAGLSLRNDEIIFYDESALLLNYIIVFK